MSEKIYAWLLRLYPRRFRETWSEAAMQLYRDRARDERGFFGRLLLWLDLLADAAVSIPREYRRPSPALATVAVRRPADALPSFQMLGSESPGAGSLTLGGAVSLAIVIALSAAGGHPRIYGSGLLGAFSPLRPKRALSCAIRSKAQTRMHTPPAALRIPTPPSAGAYWTP
jgi:hypothetical protein